MPMFTPVISATPGNMVGYNPSMADTFSWIPIAGSGRPLYAQTVYPVNMEEQLTTITNVLCAIFRK